MASADPARLAAELLCNCPLVQDLLNFSGGGSDELLLMPIDQDRERPSFSDNEP